MKKLSKFRKIRKLFLMVSAFLIAVIGFGVYSYFHSKTVSAAWPAPYRMVLGFDDRIEVV